MKKWMIDGKFKALSDAEKAELSTEDLAMYVADKNQAQLDELREEITEKLPKEGKIPTSKEVQDLSSTVADGLKRIEEETGKQIEELVKNEDFSKAIDEINETLNKQGIEIKKSKEKVTDNNKNVVTNDPIKQLIKNFVNSPEYKEFVEGGYKGSTPKMAMTTEGKMLDVDAEERKGLAEKTVSVSSDHTGNIFITDPRLNIRDFPLRQQHIRDLMPIDSTDGTQITAPEVYDYTDALNGGMQMLAENGEAQDIGFKTKENTWTLNRIAAALPLSKRYLKTNGLSWVASYLGQRLPNFVRNKEDFQLLFGDGSGENVDGLTKDAQSFNLDRATYTAGAFASVATWNSGTQSLVTFAAAHGMRNGDNLTIANAVNAGYNTTHVSTIVRSETEVIINEAYVLEADTSAWTGSSSSSWKNSIPTPNIYDVVVVAANELRTGEYMATGVVLSPVDFDKMGLIKADDLQYVGVARDAFGRVTINGLGITQTTAMPAGQFLVGDFQMAVAISEYTPLSIRAVEDTTDAKKNQVTWIIEEEFIMPKYNPFWFIYGYIEAAKTQLASA
jgi:hypothetical protein